jgi:hypothetical protein
VTPNHTPDPNVGILKQQGRKQKGIFLNNFSTIAFRPKRGQTISGLWQAGGFVEFSRLHGVDKGFPG